MKLCLSVIALILFCCCTDLGAQHESDAGLWTTFSIEKDLSKKFSISVDEEFRLRDNLTMLNLFYTNVGCSYKPANWIKISLTYRLIEKWKYEYQYFSFRHRLMLDILFKNKIGDWRFSYRSRIQSEVRDIYTSELGKVPEWFWRSKFDVKYSVGQFVPNVGAEFRYQLVDPRETDADWGWHRARTYAGLDYEINKRNTVGVYYLIQKEFGLVKPRSLYIVGVQYAVSL